MTAQLDPSSDAEELGTNHLVDVARETGKADNYTGKRGTTRYQDGMRLDVTTDPSDPSATIPATMKDVSRSGCSFWTKRKLAPKTNVHIREFAAEEDTEWLPSVVEHCTAGLRGFLVGVAFEVPKPQAVQP